VLGRFDINTPQAKFSDDLNTLIIEGFVVDRIATVDGPFPEIQEVISEQCSHLEDPLTRNVKCVYVSENKWGEGLKVYWEWWFATAVETAVRTENEADRKIEAAVGKRLEAVGRAIEFTLGFEKIAVGELST